MSAPSPALGLPGRRASPIRCGSPGSGFFDLDRTLIRRSSMLALAPTLRRHGLIGWRSLARATVWHAVYLLRGVSSRELSQVAGQTFRLMRGWPVEELRALIAEQIEPLAALAFPDAITRMRAHQSRGEQTVVVSSSLIDLVEPLAQRIWPRWSDCFACGGSRRAVYRWCRDVFARRREGGGSTALRGRAGA
jgi:hypothetical protein